MNPDNCINMAAVRFGERVTITVVSSNKRGGLKKSKTVDADSSAYSLFLELADHICWNSPLSEDSHS